MAEAGGSIVLTSNASMLLNDRKLKQLYESQAFINARRFLEALQPFFKDFKINTYQSNVLNFLMSKYVNHFQQCFIRESQRMDGFQNGDADADMETALFGLNGSTNDLPDLSPKLLDSDTVVSHGYAGSQIHPEAMRGRTRSVTGTEGAKHEALAFERDMQRRRMSDNDIALNCRNESSTYFNKKKKQKSKRSLRNGHKSKESDIDEVGKEGQEKGGFMSNMINKIRRGSTTRIKGMGLMQTDKPLLETSTKIDEIASYLKVGPTQPGENLAFHRARIVLVQVEMDYFIEIYSPHKSAKPKVTISGSDITEVRKTTALEMPDTDNSFVLKAGLDEYVIKANDELDLMTWLSKVEELGKKFGIQSNECHRQPFLPECLRETPPNSGDDTGQQMSDFSSTPPNLGKEEGCIMEDDQDVASITTAHLGTWDIKDGDEILTATVTPSDMYKFQWYHQTLPRLQAAQLVLSAHHGVFLMRESETRHAGHVLTFNFQGRAKHLRMNIESDGRCRVNHLRFTSILVMLHHFRSNPIPLDAGGPSQVSLTEFVINEKCDYQNSADANIRLSSATSDGNSEDQEPCDDTTTAGHAPAVNHFSQSSYDSNGEVITPLSGISPGASSSSAVFVTDDESPGTSGHVRAVDNAYAFS